MVGSKLSQTQSGQQKRANLVFSSVQRRYKDLVSAFTAALCRPRCSISTFLVGVSDQKLEVKMSSRKTAGRRGTTKKRAQRATSNVFAMFNQDQIQEFKEAFNMIDHNRDGFIDNEDLHDMLASLGKDPTEDYLEAMMNEAPGPINFTMFLTLFGERLQGTDPEDVIKNAFRWFYTSILRCSAMKSENFSCFDEDNVGLIHEDRLRELLTTIGDR